MALLQVANTFSNDVFSQSLEHLALRPEEWLTSIFGLNSETAIIDSIQKINLNHLIEYTRQLPNDDDYPYSRQVIWSSSQHEIMLAKWAGKSGCLPHDHGASSGFVYFLKGDFQETGFTFQNSKLRPTQKTLWKQGELSLVKPNEIHSCTPVTSGLTLHFYNPPIHHMKVYSVEKQMTFQVADSCGAWVPSTPGEIIHQESWSS